MIHGAMIHEAILIKLLRGCDQLHAEWRPYKMQGNFLMVPADVAFAFSIG
jgi:hypothetical protein